MKYKEINWIMCIVLLLLVTVVLAQEGPVPILPKHEYVLNEIYEDHITFVIEEQESDAVKIQGDTLIGKNGKFDLSQPGLKGMTILIKKDGTIELLKRTGKTSGDFKITIGKKEILVNEGIKNIVMNTDGELNVDGVPIKNPNLVSSVSSNFVGEIIIEAKNGRKTRLFSRDFLQVFANTYVQIDEKGNVKISGEIGHELVVLAKADPKKNRNSMHFQKGSKGITIYPDEEYGANIQAEKVAEGSSFQLNGEKFACWGDRDRELYELSKESLYYKGLAYKKEAEYHKIIAYEKEIKQETKQKIEKEIRRLFFLSHKILLKRYTLFDKVYESDKNNKDKIIFNFPYSINFNSDGLNGHSVETDMTIGLNVEQENKPNYDLTAKSDNDLGKIEVNEYGEKFLSGVSLNSEKEGVNGVLHTGTLKITKKSLEAIMGKSDRLQKDGTPLAFRTDKRFTKKAAEIKEWNKKNPNKKSQLSCTLTINYMYTSGQNKEPRL